MALVGQPGKLPATPGLGTLNLPELDTARRKRADEILAEYQKQATGVADRNAKDVALYSGNNPGDTPNVGTGIADARARGQKSLEDTLNTWELNANMRTPLTNIWLTGLRGASQTRMDKMGHDAAERWRLSHPTGGGGGGGRRRGGGGGGSGSSGSGALPAPSAPSANAGDIYQQVAQQLLSAGAGGAPTFGGSRAPAKKAPSRARVLRY